MFLSEKQIQYGFNHKTAKEVKAKCILEVSEYCGESKLEIICTQLSDDKYKTQKEKKRVLQEWCDFLSNNPDAFEELKFHSRMPQELFNAVCEQKKLKKLIVKWGSYPDISRLANLHSLEYLRLGSGSGVKDIEPISKLPNLIALSVENFQNITDYSDLACLGHLESLEITGDGLSPKYIHVDTLEFLTKMPQLRFFRFLTARLKSKDLTPILSLKNLEYLTLAATKETKAIYPRLIKLPKLKYGLLVEKPELYI